MCVYAYTNVCLCKVISDCVKYLFLIVIVFVFKSDLIYLNFFY